MHNVLWLGGRSAWIVLTAISGITVVTAYRQLEGGEGSRFEADVVGPENQDD